MAGDFSSLPAKRKVCWLLVGSRRVWNTLGITTPTRWNWATNEPPRKTSDITPPLSRGLRTHDMSHPLPNPPKPTCVPPVNFCSCYAKTNKDPYSVNVNKQRPTVYVVATLSRMWIKTETINYRSLYCKQL